MREVFIYIFLLIDFGVYPSLLNNIESTKHPIFIKDIFKKIDLVSATERETQISFYVTGAPAELHS